MNNRLFTCAGGATGVWRIVQMKTIVGEPLPQVEFLNITSETLSAAPGTQWLLRGITSNERYVERDEKNRLAAKQPALGRPEAVRAALIPMCIGGINATLNQNPRHSNRVDDRPSLATTPMHQRSRLDDVFCRLMLTTEIGVV